ncbi:MAG: glycosyltransferase [Alicyclobacillus sp.]|nr:glycosyltransferase [Alicyclobacillus sp.]
MTKVLIATASFGEGHNQAAHAVREALQERGADVQVVDYVEWLHPAVRSFAKFSLLQGVQHVPRLYGLFYRSMGRLKPTSALQRGLHHLGAAAFQHWLDVYNPDVVVNTFPAPAGVLSELRARGEARVPSLTVITDYTAHRQWVQELTDVYCVANAEVGAELSKYGVSASQIRLTGIPLRQRFALANTGENLQQRHLLRQRYGLPAEQPVVLVMGGGGGVIAEAAEWAPLLRTAPVTLVVVCGHNQRLQRRFAAWASERVRVLGYTERIDEWMALADAVVTKPGGLTVTECLAMELPMILYRPTPGQESCNAQYILRTGAAVLAEDVAAVRTALEDVVVGHPQRLQAMRAAARELRPWVTGAAKRVADAVLELAAQRPCPTPAGVHPSLVPGGTV